MRLHLGSLVIKLFACWYRSQDQVFWRQLGVGVRQWMLKQFLPTSSLAQKTVSPAAHCSGRTTWCEVGQVLNCKNLHVNDQPSSSPWALKSPATNLMYSQVLSGLVCALLGQSILVLQTPEWSVPISHWHSTHVSFGLQLRVIRRFQVSF